MATNTLAISDGKRRVEKVRFNFSNPGEVEIEVPIITCENTQQKFFHPEDVDYVLEELDREYHRVHKLLKGKKN